MKSLISLTLTMSLALAGLLLFAGTGMAATVEGNATSNFYDTFDLGIHSQANQADPVYESSAPGSRRLVEGNAAADFYDTFDLGSHGQTNKVMKRNWSGEKPSANFYDIVIK
jgi:hypothetical protein